MGIVGGQVGDGQAEFWLPVVREQIEMDRQVRG